MDLYPAIDLRGGRCVRLLRGDYRAETVYDDDPAARARAFVEAGARWVHVVDLDAARTGEASNLAAIADVCAAVGGSEVSVQVGGGVRDAAAAERLWSLGASRVVLGTAAVQQPELVDDLADVCPGGLAVGLDARGDEVAVRGWTEGSGASLLDLVRRFDRPGVGALIVTSIQRDGTLEGPDVDQLERVLEASSVDVVASGGVGDLDDLQRLAAVQVGGRSLGGVVVGRALYEERFTVDQAIETLRRAVDHEAGAS